MNRGFRYWAGEAFENFGLPVLGVALFGGTFFLAQLLPWWGIGAIYGAVLLAGWAFLRPKKKA